MLKERRLFLVGGLVAGEEPTCTNLRSEQQLPTAALIHVLHRGSEALLRM